MCSFLDSGLNVGLLSCGTTILIRWLKATPLVQQAIILARTFPALSCTGYRFSSKWMLGKPSTVIVSPFLQGHKTVILIPFSPWIICNKLTSSWDANTKMTKGSLFLSESKMAPSFSTRGTSVYPGQSDSRSRNSLLSLEKDNGGWGLPFLPTKVQSLSLEMTSADFFPLAPPLLWFCFPAPFSSLDTPLPPSCWDLPGFF